MISTPCTRLPGVSQSPGREAEPCHRGSPLVTSSGFLLTFPPRPELPLFLPRRPRPLPEPHHPPWWQGMTEQWVWLVPPASCSSTQSQCRRLPVPSLPELQKGVELRTHSQNNLCLFCGYHLLLGRAPLKRAERKRVKITEHFLSLPPAPEKKNRRQSSWSAFINDRAGSPRRGQLKSCLHPHLEKRAVSHSHCLLSWITWYTMCWVHSRRTLMWETLVRSRSSITGSKNGKHSTSINLWYLCAG